MNSVCDIKKFILEKNGEYARHFCTKCYLVFWNFIYIFILKGINTICSKMHINLLKL